MSPRKATAARDRSAEHAWNADPTKSRALHGPGHVAAPIPLADSEKLRAARAIAAQAADAAELRVLLDAAGLDHDELRAMRAAATTDAEETP